MTFEIESDVPLEEKRLHADEYLTTFICRRNTNRHRRGQTVALVRKFLADCGTKIVVQIGVRGGILKMEPEYPCDAGKECPSCLDRMAKTRILIESGK